jgi:hypothetical protein
MEPLPNPRPYWIGIPDYDLADAAAEYRGTRDPYLQIIASEIDDDLARRADQRRRQAALA